MSEWIDCKDLVTQSTSALIGVIAALWGTWRLENMQRKQTDAKDNLQLLEQRTQAGHKAMLAIDSQRDLARTLHAFIKDEPDHEKWKIVRANCDNLPRINVEELQFLITEACNKNIIPCAIGYQQNFNQLITMLDSFSATRRELEIAQRKCSPLVLVYRDELRGIAESITGCFSKLFGKYDDLQAMLVKGLQQQIPDFKPIFKI